MNAIGARLHRIPPAAVVEALKSFDGIVIRVGAQVRIANKHPGRPLSFDTIHVSRDALTEIGIKPRMGMRLHCEFMKVWPDDIGAFIVTGHASK